MNEPSGTPSGEIWAIDWRGSERARRILGSWVRAARVRGKDPRAVFVHAPGGSHGGLDTVLEGVEILDAAQLLTPEDGAKVDAWTLRRSEEILASGLIPPQGPLDLDRLNLLDLQDALKRYRTLRDCLFALSLARGTTRIRFFSFDAALASALRRGCESEGLSMQASGMVAFARGLQERFQGRRGSGPRRRVRRPFPAGREPVVLDPMGAGGAICVSWTRPMLEMFAEVRRPMERSGRPWLHLHYGPSSDAAEPRCLDVMAAARAETDDTVFRQWAGRSPTLAEPFRDRPEYPILRSHGRTLHTWFLDLQVAHGRLVDRLLDEAAPGVVLVGNDRWWTGQTWTQLARRRGIPTLGLQDGIAAASAQWAWLTADRVALMGPNVQDCLLEAGVPPERIAVTGQPRYDRLLARAGLVERAETRARLGISTDVPIVVFATQYSQDPSFVDEVCSAILAAPAVHLLLRPHPSGTDEPHRAVAARFGPERVSLERTARIDDLLVASDVVVVQHSTVAFEADLLGRRVILADFSGASEPQYAQGVRAIRARSPREVGNGIVRALAEGPFEPGGSEAIRRFVGPTDGHAGERVARLVDDLMDAGRVG